MSYLALDAQDLSPDEFHSDRLRGSDAVPSDKDVKKLLLRKGRITYFKGRLLGGDRGTRIGGDRIPIYCRHS